MQNFTSIFLLEEVRPIPYIVIDFNVVRALPIPFFNPVSACNYNRLYTHWSYQTPNYSVLAKAKEIRDKRWKDSIIIIGKEQHFVWPVWRCMNNIDDLPKWIDFCNISSSIEDCFGGNTLTKIRVKTWICNSYVCLYVRFYLLDGVASQSEYWIYKPIGF